MTNKMVLIGIAIAAIGLIALPQTLALFAGQHNWYTVTQIPTDWTTLSTPGTWDTGVPCQKCHADVYAEKALPGPHRVSVTCESCHIVALALNGSIVGGGNGSAIHAAGLPSCLDCHSKNASGIPKWSGAPDAVSIFNSTEAHSTFANQSKNSQLLIGPNEACVACHTHVAVDINWQKAYKIGFNAVQAATTGEHTWSVTNFVAEGKVTVDTYGNRSGQTTGMSTPVIDISGVTAPGYNSSNP